MTSIESCSFKKLDHIFLFIFNKYVFKTLAIIDWYIYFLLLFYYFKVKNLINTVKTDVVRPLQWPFALAAGIYLLAMVKVRLSGSGILIYIFFIIIFRGSKISITYIIIILL